MAGHYAEKDNLTDAIKVFCRYVVDIRGTYFVLGKNIWFTFMKKYSIEYLER